MIQTQKQESRGNVAEKKKQGKINFAELLMKKVQMDLMKPKSSAATQIWDSKIRMWRVSDFQKVPYPHIGHFFSADAYIILYSYTKVEGGKSFHILFFWQGRDIKKKDKGTSAYKTVEVNEMIDEGVVEHQIRVVQDKEPQAFMNLFAAVGSNEDEATSNGGKKAPKLPYMVHKGKYRDSVLEAFEKANKQGPVKKKGTSPFVNKSMKEKNVDASPTKVPQLNNMPTGGSENEENQQPVKLFSNVSGNLDDNESEKTLSPQMLQFQKEMIESLVKRCKYEQAYRMLDVRFGKVCECDDVHPVYLNPYHAVIFSNLNYSVELNRKELGEAVSALEIPEESSELATIVYYGKFCPSAEKEFIEKNLLEGNGNIIVIDEASDDFIQQLSSLVFRFDIDPCFEAYLARYSNYLKTFEKGPVSETAKPSIYSINDHSGEFAMTQLQVFGESDLSSTQAFILDTLDLEGRLYVWIGQLCNVETKKFALISASEYFHTWMSQQKDQTDNFYDKKNSELNVDTFEPSHYVKPQHEICLRVVTEMEEPPEFTKHFGAWSTNSASFKIRYKQIRDPSVISKGFVKTPRTPRRTTGVQKQTLSDHSSGVFELEHCTNVIQLYNKLFTHKTYSYKELTCGTLPEGIDKSRLESYLSNAEFHKIFGMDQKKFSELQSWKQTSLKKEKNLF